MRFRFLACVVALGAGLTSARAADPVTVLDLAVHSARIDQPRSPVDAAVALAARAQALDAVETTVDPETGGLALVVPRQGTVVLFPKFVAGAGKRAEPIVTKVGGFPAGIAFKKFGGKSYFVVACHLGKELVLLDAVTLKREKTIALALGRPHSVLTSLGPKDPFVYYTTRIGEPPRDGPAFGWVNLTTSADESRAGGTFAEDLAVSADGTRLFTRSARTVYALDAPGAPGRALTPKRLAMPPDGPWLVADPRGEYLIGERAWSLKDEKASAPLPVLVAHASPTAPALFGIDRRYKQLSALSTNSLKVVGFVGLALTPPECRTHKEIEVRERDGVTIAAPRLQVLEDPTTKTVLLVSGRTVRLVPFSALGLTDEPALDVALGGPLEFLVGRRHEVKVTPSAGATAELTSGPEGMNLEAGALVWTAGESAVGLHSVALKLSAKGATRTVLLSARARRPSLTLPFEPTEYVDPANPGFRSNLPNRPRFLSADGSTAVFLGHERTEGKNPPMNRIAVVNLDKLEIEAERKSLVGFTTAAVDDRHVFVGLAESEAVKVLARKDLSDREVIYTAGRPADLALAGGALLVTSWKRDRPDPYRTEAFDAASLKPKPFDVIAVKQWTREVPGGATVPPAAVRGGWWYDGAVFDAKFDKVRAVVNPRAFWAWHAKAKVLLTDPPADPPLDRPPLGEGRWYTPWGVSLTNAQLLVEGKRVGFVPASAAPPAPVRPHAVSIALPDRPAVACLTLAEVRGRDKRPVTRAEVTFYNLTAAEPGATVVLNEHPVNPDPHAPRTHTDLLLAPISDGRLMAIVGREVFAFKVPVLDPDKFPQLLHFAPDFPVIVGSADEVSVALPATTGGNAPITFKLAEEVPGVRIDEQNKKLVIAPRELVPALTDQLAVVARKAQKEATLKTYLEVVGPRFERWTGKKPAGVPVWVPVSLLARDKLLGEATGRFGFFVDVPLEGVKAKLGAKP